MMDAKASYVVSEFALTDTPTRYVSSPDIDGDVILWSVGRLDPNPGIFGYHLGTGEHFQVNNGGPYGVWGPRVGEDWAVWEAYLSSTSSPETEVVLYNLRTHEERTPSQADASGPRTDGRYVVWTWQNDIWLYEIATDVSTQMTSVGYNGGAVVEYPWLVWRVQDTPGDRLAAYNISTTETITVTRGPDANAPDIDGGVVVWSMNTSSPVAGRNIFGLDLGAGIPFTVTQSTHSNLSPYIDGNIVVWHDSTIDVEVGKNLATGETFTVTNPAFDACCVRLSGHVVVWKRYVEEADGWVIIGGHLWEHAVFLPVVTLDYWLPPTPVPVCQCHDDVYDCSDFSTWAEAQACYEYCLGYGAGDVHGLDWNGDGVACERLQ